MFPVVIFFNLVLLVCYNPFYLYSNIVEGLELIWEGKRKGSEDEQLTSFDMMVSLVFIHK